MRAEEMEERLRSHDWAALEKLSGMWREGRIPKEQVLEILELILPQGEKDRGEAGLMMGECRIG